MKVAIAPISELPENGTRVFALNGRSVLVARTAAGVFALENKCSHAQQVLEGGKLKGFHIFCPAHGMRFDMRDGSPAGTLAKTPVTVWKTESVDGIVYIDMDAP